MSALLLTIRPVLAELAVLSALAAPPVWALARRPAGDERLVTVPPKLWVRVVAWSFIALLVWAAAARAWLGISHPAFDARASIAGAAVQAGVAAVLWLHYATMTLVAGRDGVHWFSFRRAWSELSAVTRTDTGVRFEVEGRPAPAEAAILDTSFWRLDDERWRILRALVRGGGAAPADSPSPGPGEPGSPRGRHGGRGGARGPAGDPGVRRPLPRTSRRRAQ